MSEYKYNFECPKCGEELRYIYNPATNEKIIHCSECDFREKVEE